MLNVSDTLFELVYSGYNAFESLSTFLYHLKSLGIEISNGITSVVISIDSGYSTCLEFNESVNSDRIKVFTLVSMTINVAFNTQSDSWYFDQSSDNTTINKHGWIL